VHTGRLPAHSTPVRIEMNATTNHSNSFFCIEKIASVSYLRF
jgi:hypothetical protein